MRRTPLPFLEGPQTYGRGWVFWILFLVVVVALYLGPEYYFSRYDTLTFSKFYISAILAISLCLIWGYCSILSLGQAAFAAIGGYAYGVVALNLIDAHNNTYLALLSAVAVPAAVAFALGAVMFFARLKGVYVAILTLVLSLLLEIFMNQTADPYYQIGEAALGGFNGMQPRPPNLQFSLFGYEWEVNGRRAAFNYFSLSILLALYLFLRWLLNATPGYLMVGVREDDDRVATFGYDDRKIKLWVFCLAAGVAGLAGGLLTAATNYVEPSRFGVQPNILVVIWVAIAGRKDITAAIVGAIALEYFSLQLSRDVEFEVFGLLIGLPEGSSLVILGGMLIAVMMIAPQGAVTAVVDAWRRWRGIGQSRKDTAAQRVLADRSSTQAERAE